MDNEIAQKMLMSND